MAVNSVASNDPKAVGTSADKPIAKAVDPEFKAFSDKVNARAGKTLSPERLNGLWAIHQARSAKSSALSKTKSEFEATQDKETLSVSAKAGDAGLNKLTATTTVNTVTGLSDAQITQISSALSAGPILPPIGADPISAEGASGVLDKVLSSFEVNSGPVDLKAYSKSLVSADPVKTTPQPRVIGQVNIPGSPKVMGAAPKVAGAKSVAMGPTAGAATLSFNSRSAALNKKTSASSTGGLKSTYWESGKPRFNWDYFVVKFMMTSQKELHEWKKFMKEMQQADRDFSMQVMKFRIANKERQVKSEKLKSVVDFVKSASSVIGTLRKSGVGTIAGPADGPATEKARAKSDDKLQKDLGAIEKSGLKVPGENRKYLSDSELTTLTDSAEGSESKTAALNTYKATLNARKGLEGLTGSLALMYGEASTQNDAAKDAVKADIEKATTHLDKEIAGLSEGGKNYLRASLTKNMAAIEKKEPEKNSDSKNVSAINSQKAGIYSAFRSFDKAEASTVAKDNPAFPTGPRLSTDQLIAGGKDLDAKLATEKEYNDGTRADRRGDPYKADKLAGKISQFTNAVDQVDQALEKSLDKSLAKTLAMARKNAHQLNSVIAKAEAKMQGMINQLMSLLDMSRR
ncbi:hypothetical protein KAI87_10040 [Myxococcota bacterium]|nr:hypothetical protein [Myxococcota bacterium]